MSFRRFTLPCEKEKYAGIVGSLLPIELERIFRELNFIPILIPRQTNGVDIQIYQNDSIVLVGEILNWSISSRLNNKRKEKIIENLCEYEDPCKRVLFHTVPTSNIDDEFSENSIDVVCFGFQILIPEHYNFFRERNQVIRRRPLNRRSYISIKMKVLHYLRTNGLFED